MDIATSWQTFVNEIFVAELVTGQNKFWRGIEMSCTCKKKPKKTAFILVFLYAINASNQMHWWWKGQLFVLFAFCGKSALILEKKRVCKTNVRVCLQTRKLQYYGAFIVLGQIRQMRQIRHIRQTLSRLYVRGRVSMHRALFKDVKQLVWYSKTLLDCFCCGLLRRFLRAVFPTFQEEKSQRV